MHVRVRGTHAMPACPQVLEVAFSSLMELFGAETYEQLAVKLKQPRGRAYTLKVGGGG